MSARTIGHYELEGLLGEGGIGQVFAAHDPVLGRKVAIKMLRPELARDGNFVERFYAEAKNLGTLNHSNITTIYALQTEGDDAFMVMELVNGQTLEQLLARVHRLTLHDSLAVLAQAIPGIRYAHRRGVIHRDLKPANLMVTDDGIVKIMDFGIARVQGSQHLTRVGEFCGTFVYASPEQIRGEEVDERSDLYSLAIVFYRMLAGTAPFTGDNEYALMTAQLQTPPPPLVGRVPDLDEATEQILMRALAKRPEDRFGSVEEFGRAIGAMALRGESVEVLTQLYARAFSVADLDQTRVVSGRPPSSFEQTRPSGRQILPPAGSVSTAGHAPSRPSAGATSRPPKSAPATVAASSSRGDFALHNFAPIPAATTAVGDRTPSVEAKIRRPVQVSGTGLAALAAIVLVSIGLAGGTFYWMVSDETAPAATQPMASVTAPVGPVAAPPVSTTAAPPAESVKAAADTASAPVETAKAETPTPMPAPVAAAKSEPPPPAPPPAPIEAAKVDAPIPAPPPTSVDTAQAEPPIAPPPSVEIARVDPIPPSSAAIQAVEPKSSRPPRQSEPAKAEESPPPLPQDQVAKVEESIPTPAVKPQPPPPPLSLPIEPAQTGPQPTKLASAQSSGIETPAPQPEKPSLGLETTAPVTQAQPPQPAAETKQASAQPPHPAEPPAPLGPKAKADPSMPEGAPDLKGRVGGAKRIDEIEVAGRWIKIYGIVDRARGNREARQVQTLLRYLRPARNVLVCYHKAGDTYRCYADGQDIAQLALLDGVVQLAPDAPAEYRALKPKD